MSTAFEKSLIYRSRLLSRVCFGLVPLESYMRALAVKVIGIRLERLVFMIFKGVNPNKYFYEILFWGGGGGGFFF